MAQTPEEIKAKKLASAKKKRASKQSQIEKYGIRKTAKETIKAGLVTALENETIAKKIASLNVKIGKVVVLIDKYALTIVRLESERHAIDLIIAELMGTAI